MFTLLSFFKSFRKQSPIEDLSYTLGIDMLPTVSFGVNDTIFRPSFKNMPYNVKPGNLYVRRLRNRHHSLNQLL